MEQHLSGERLKVYIGPLLEHDPVPILYPHVGFENSSQALFIDSAFKMMAEHEPFFDLVFSPEDSDILLIPHNYAHIRSEKSYLDEYERLSKEHHKKILVYCGGDYSGPVHVKNAVILRTSQYRDALQANEIIMPAPAPDVGMQSLRPYSPKPIIGFCGWADFSSFWVQGKALAQDFFCEIKSLRKREMAYRKNGVRMRNKILTLLDRQNFFVTNFILRKSFSGHPATIALEKETAREEYIRNIHESDLLVAVRGYGNYSIRFLEILSAGRIPLFIDTGNVLPLEDVIDYKSFVLRIDYGDVSNLNKKVHEFWSNLSPQEYENHQKRAREAFEKYLCFDCFFEYFFKHEIKKFL